MTMPTFFSYADLPPAEDYAGLLAYLHLPAETFLIGSILNDRTGLFEWVRL